MDNSIEGRPVVGGRVRVVNGARLRVFVAAAIVATALPALAGDWPSFGGNIENTASTFGGHVDPSKLERKWTFTTAGDVSARAAVVDGVVYVPDWGGYLYALDAKTGAPLWQRALSSYLDSPTDVHSRTSPAVAKGTVYIGTQEGAYMLAIDARTGNLKWATQVESVDPYAFVTASPVVFGDTVYTGVASNQEGLAGFVQGFPCCDARGSVVALNAHTGAVKWKTYTTPVGYSGVGVWGSNLVVDPLRHSVYAGTGNNYSQPTDPAYLTCLANGGTPASCDSPDNHVDSILALDMASGRLKWSHKAVIWNQQAYGVTDGSDHWNVSCFVAPYTNCPPTPGPDYDFASAPNLVTFVDKHGLRQILGAGQKSGIYYALDPDTGKELWETQVGPGSSLGGMEWGSATDGKRIYVAISNYFGIPSGAGSAGSWAALDPATGAVLWQVADPNGAIDLGPLAAVDGAVYASSMAGDASAPTMFALDARTGSTLWSFAAGSSVNAGAVVAEDMVFWGSGYAHLGIPGFTGNTAFYAFSKKGK